MRNVDSLIHTLSSQRNEKRREAELRSWLIGTAVTFLVCLCLPLASILPAYISEKVEMILEGALLLLTLLLLFQYFFGEGRRGGNKQKEHTKPTVLPPAGSTAAPTSGPSSLSQHSQQLQQLHSGSAASTSTFSPSYLGAPAPSSQQGSVRRRMLSPQAGGAMENFRSFSSDYSWKEITQTANASSSLSPGMGGLQQQQQVISTASEWGMNVNIAEYQASPKEKVRGVKKLDDGRAIPYQPAMLYIGRDEIPSRWSEALRKCLGLHLTASLRDFDRACKDLWEAADKNLSKLLTEGGGAPASVPAVPSFGLSFMQPAPLVAAAAAPVAVAPEVRQGIRDVLLLKQESVVVDNKNLDLFAFLEKAKFEQQIDLSLVFRKYREAIQTLSLLGMGCPLQTRTRGLSAICKEMRSMCSAHGPHLRLAGSHGSGRSSHHGSTGHSDDELIMSIFFSYCDADRDQMDASAKHNFTRDYYLPSYEDLLNARGSVQNVGIVRNYQGRFDVFVKTATGVLLLEVGDESENLGHTAFNAILIFLVVFYADLARNDVDGEEERAAIDLLMETLGCKTRDDLRRELYNAFPRLF